MSPPTTVLQHRVVAELCHKERPFCPWARRQTMPEGIKYLRFDIAPLQKEGLDVRNGVRNDFLNLLRVGRTSTLPLASLEKGSVHELYFSHVITNPYLDDKFFPDLVDAAHRVLDPHGTLIVFNGYLDSSFKILIDFAAGLATLPKWERPSGYSAESETAVNFTDMLMRLNACFRPLSFDAHKRFLAERDLGLQTELRPGEHISVLTARN